MKDSLIALDLAKRAFRGHGASMSGHVKVRQTLNREQFWRFMSGQPGCIVVFEACGSAKRLATKPS